ncbi:ABC transporter substrate-binding protein [Peterkaempfera bronchialis]|uniref:Amino acid ABC transporter substrate-binding protein n=1 Tax=Peterkaempfera bronchialis TaxID=2126346 RepID=A0A345T3M6_9ACTN|nr:ABC transporter substrate-binding protein [Peterkaempfera bronchialis]AXI80581.1 amino acid ABC transporter substrate-binding protein [Peterkaempfera bronchialis]
MSKRVSRRDFVRGVGAATVGGAIVGGAGGFVVAPATREDTFRSSAGRGGTLRIGGLVPVTGAYSADGQEMRRGQEMAIAEINAGGGVLGSKLELVVADVADIAPEKFINGARKLAQGDRTAALFGGYTSSTQAEFPAIAQIGTPFFHANTLQADVDAVKKAGYTNIFETDPTERWYGPGFLSLAKNWIDSGVWKPKNRTIAVITTTDPYSTSISDSVRKSAKEHGWDISLYEQVTAPLADWGPTLAKIRANPPGLIFHADYITGDLASFTKQFRSSPTPSLLFEQYGPSVPEYLDLTGDAANGVLWSTVIGTIPDERGKAFMKQYREKYGAAAGLSQAGAQYDAVHLWATAVRQVNDPYDFRAVSQAVLGITHRGVSGGYTFVEGEQAARQYPDQTRDAGLGMAHQTYQIQDRKHVLIAPEPYIQGEFQLPPWL